jgi:hypothetical protein
VVNGDNRGEAANLIVPANAANGVANNDANLALGTPLASSVAGSDALAARAIGIALDALPGLKQVPEKVAAAEAVPVDPPVALPSVVDLGQGTGTSALPQNEGLVTDLVFTDRALQEAIHSWTTLFATSPLTPWVVALTAVGAAAEVARRQLKRSRALALAGLGAGDLDGWELPEDTPQRQ